MTAPTARYAARMSDGAELVADTRAELARAIAAHTHRTTWATMSTTEQDAATATVWALITGDAA